MTRPRVVVAGLGDSGLLTALHLARHPVDVVGIGSQPAHVSGQELGMRLARPDHWAREYDVAWHRYRRLDRARVVHGSVTGLDLDARTVAVELPGGAVGEEPFDALVIATGVSNGFWRRPDLRTREQVDDDLRAAHERLAVADSIAVVGGGAAAVSTALEAKLAWPATRVDLYFPGERALPTHHGRVWSAHARPRLLAAGVGLHPGHRAVVPDGFALDRITEGPVAWSTGQPPADADAVLWAIGLVRPHTEWLARTAPSVLDADGFVRATATLQVPDHPGLWTIGDVAATDPLRSSARNRADHLLAANILTELGVGVRARRPLRRFRPSRRRWGSVLGHEPDGVHIFFPNGRALRFPAWSVGPVMGDLITRRVIHRGVRRR